MPSIHPLLLRCFESAGIDTTSLRSSGSSCITDPSGTSWFAKTGHNVSQMQGETAGLRAMAATAPPGLVPRVLGFEVSPHGQEAAMVSQYFDLTSGKNAAETQRELGRKLAKMHTRPPEGTPGYTGQYGFAIPTHCGVTEQDNTWEESWEFFYRERRLGDLVKRIGDGQISKEWDKLKQKAVPLLLHQFEPAPQPVILHGDLWSGNAGYDRTTSSPVIYDPACYYGHNEADLGITHMFGGFSKDFFDEYHKHLPRSEPYCEERQKLYELYHHLNHTLMFGESYKSGALGIMRSLSSWAEDIDK